MSYERKTIILCFSFIAKHFLYVFLSGDPGVDYPIFSSPPATSFSCSGRIAGLYADVEGRCQVWHQCWAGRGWTFLCPNGTIFSQRELTCVWWFNWDCDESENYFDGNSELYQGQEDSGRSKVKDERSDVLPSSTESTNSPGPLLPLLPVTDILEEELEENTFKPTPAPTLYGAPRLSRRRGRKISRRRGRTFF